MSWALHLLILRRAPDRLYPAVLMAVGKQRHLVQGPHPLLLSFQEGILRLPQTRDGNYQYKIVDHHLHFTQSIILYKIL